MFTLILAVLAYKLHIADRQNSDLLAIMCCLIMLLGIFFDTILILELK